MIRLLVAAFVLGGLALPAVSHPHGAKSKRYQGKYYRYNRRAHRRNWRHRRYRRSDRFISCASPGPYFHAGQFPAWAACAFAPRGRR